MDFFITGERKAFLEKKKNVFASKERKIYTKILEYIKSDFPFLLEAFKTSYDIKIEKKDKFDKKYEKSQKKIKEFHFILSEFLKETFLFKNKIGYDFLHWIYDFIDIYIKDNNKQTYIYENYIAKTCNIENNRYEEEGCFVKRIEQFIIFLKMFINFKDEEIISTIEIQSFKDIFKNFKKRDTIKLLREKFPNQITNNCSENEKNFDINAENFKSKD